MRLKEVLEEKHKKAKVLAQEIGADEPMISKFANYKCLPIPVQMEKICESLDCQISDIYKDEEIYYKQAHRKPTKKATQKAELLDFYNLCVRLPRDACKWLARENLKKLGYKDLSDWIRDCYRQLLEKIKKDRSDANENGQAK